MVRERKKLFFKDSVLEEYFSVLSLTAKVSESYFESGNINISKKSGKI